MNRSLIVMVVVAGMGVAACGSSSKTSTNSSTASTAGATATTAPAASTTTAATTSAVLQVAMNAKVKQNIIVDSAGKTVYIYMPDGSSTTSKVPAALKSAWPAVTTTSEIAAVGAGLTGSEATVNSAHQVAYNHHLLYTFQGDTSAGTANGQGLGNIWYVLSPSGTPIT